MEQTTQLINKDMTMGEIIQKYPAAADIMQSFGLHCFGCHVNLFETLEQGILGHGMPEETMHELLAELNKMASGSDTENIVAEEQMPEISMTEVAAKKMAEILKSQNKADYGIRVQVVRGGCAGYMYNMDFAKDAGSNDKEISSNGIRLIVDKDSYEMLRGVVIDYVETLQGAGFKFDNPNAKSTCGCGKSYH